MLGAIQGWRNSFSTILTTQVRIQTCNFLFVTFWTLAIVYFNKGYLSCTALLMRKESLFLARLPYLLLLNTAIHSFMGMSSRLICLSLVRLGHHNALTARPHSCLPRGGIPFCAFPNCFNERTCRIFLRSIPFVVRGKQESFEYRNTKSIGMTQQEN